MAVQSSSRSEPQAYYVKWRGHGLLLYRALHPLTGQLREEYSVIALPPECDGETLRYSGFVPPEDSRLLGTVPVRDLHFEQPGGEDLDESSLSSALRRLEAGTREEIGAS
jgi:hypothetical protein